MIEYFLNYLSLNSIEEKSLVCFFIAVTFGAILLFDKSRWKLNFLVTVTILFLFFNTNELKGNILSYQFLSVVNLLIIGLIFLRSPFSNFLRNIWLIVLISVFSLLGVLYLDIIPIIDELHISIGVFIILSLMPFLYNDHKLSSGDAPWSLIVFQQYFLRFYMIFWSVFYSQELIASKLFLNANALIISGIVAIPFWLIVNWKNVRGFYLSESFISLVVLLVSLTGSKDLLSLLLMMNILGVYFSLEKNKEIIGEKYLVKKIAQSLDRGGVGGFYYIMTSLVAIILAESFFYLGVILWGAVLVLSILLWIQPSPQRLSENKINDETDQSVGLQQNSFMGWIKILIHVLSFSLLFVFRTKLGVF